MTVVGSTAREGKLLVNRASWTLVDQGVVSLGNFVLNIQLARGLTAAEYGKFALFLSAIFVLRAIDYSLISYPLSIRLCAATGAEHDRLLTSTVLLAAVLALVLVQLLGVGIVLSGGSDILAAALACYLAWQAQETMRRSLLAKFRYRAAVTGDATSFIGQALLVGMLGWMGVLTLVSALYAMSATFAAGALVHASRLRFARPSVASARRAARDCLSLGKWSLVNEMLLVRAQLVPGALGALVGPAATATFQAAANIASLMNPVAFGIANAIPPAVAQARRASGVSSAWTVARNYILFGLPLVLAVCAGGLFAPRALLQLMYGTGSPYVGAALCVQLLVIAWAADYVAEMVGKTLLGVEAGRLASLVNLASLATAVIALPLIVAFGVVGACLALAGANVVRLIAAWMAMSWLITNVQSQDEVALERGKRP